MLFEHEVTTGSIVSEVATGSLNALRERVCNAIASRVASSTAQLRHQTTRRLTEQAPAVLVARTDTRRTVNLRRPRRVAVTLHTPQQSSLAVPPSARLRSTEQSTTVTGARQRSLRKCVLNVQRDTAAHRRLVRISGLEREASCWQQWCC